MTKTTVNPNGIPVVALRQLGGNPYIVAGDATLKLTAFDELGFDTLRGKFVLRDAQGDETLVKPLTQDNLDAAAAIATQHADILGDPMTTSPLREMLPGFMHGTTRPHYSVFQAAHASMVTPPHDSSVAAAVATHD